MAGVPRAAASLCAGGGHVSGCLAAARALSLQDLAHECFPPHLGKSAEEMHAFMLSSFCAAATCRWQQCAPRPSPVVAACRRPALDGVPSSVRFAVADGARLHLALRPVSAQARRREKLLEPLARNRPSGAYVRGLLVCCVAALVLIFYAAALLQWHSRVASDENSLTYALRALGVKRKADKLM